MILRDYQGCPGNSALEILAVNAHPQKWIDAPPAASPAVRATDTLSRC
jgi:hypothetical protein